VCVGGWYGVIPRGTFEILLLFYVDTEVISLYGSEFEFELKLTAC